MTVSAPPTLTKHKVIWPEELSESARPDRVHGARLQVHQNSPGHVLSPAGLVVVDIDPLQLKVGVAVVGARRVNAVLVRNDLPELRTCVYNITLIYTENLHAPAREAIWQ